MPPSQWLACCLPCGGARPASQASAVRFVETSEPATAEVVAPATGAPAPSITASAAREPTATDEASKRAVVRTHVFFRWAEPGISRPVNIEQEEVRVIGDGEELGNWDPQKGVVLKVAEGASPVWRSKGVPLPLCRPVEYQYVVCQRGTGVKKFSIDEKRGKRTVVPTGKRHVLEDDCGAFRDQDVSGDTGASNQHKDVQRFFPNSPKGGQGKCSNSIQRLEERLEKERALELTNADCVVVCVRTLPVRVESDGEGGWRVVQRIEKDKNPFTVANLLQSMRQDEELVWSLKLVGQPGIHVSDPTERQKICELLASHNCIPVFTEEAVFDQHLKFSREFLWPVMHNMKSQASDSFDDIGWRGYQAMNKAYADAVLESAPGKAIVWVHDFHLLLVPRYLKLKAKNLTLGFFLHCAFPSSEVLRCIPIRDDIMVSLLSCHVVSFQIFEYTRHFITCCQMLVDSAYSFQEGGVLQIEYDNRSVVVRTDHIVLPVSHLQSLLEDEAVYMQAQSLRKTYGDRKIFAAIDGDEPFSGMPMKIRAFQNFLSDCPQHRHKVALFQHVVVKKEHDADSRDILEIVKGLAQEINQTYCCPGEPPLVHISTEKLSVQERLGLLLATDVLLDTSINDGLNLYPFMFYLAHTKDQKGIAIVSEFTGCSSALTGSLKVNPWNTKAVMEAMHNSLIMDENEQAMRFMKDHSYVSSQAFSTWVYQNLMDLKATHTQQSRTIGFATSGFDMSFMSSGFRPLNFDQVVKAYKQAQVRCIFLDSEGTLMSGKENRIRSGQTAYGRSQAQHQVPAMDSDVLDTLTKLVEDQRNIVVIISGREKQAMDQWYGSIPDIGLCAEHGFYFVMPKKLKPAGSTERWQAMQVTQDGDWKSVAFELFKQYVKRVQGSYIQYKGSAISWHYKEVGAPAIAREIAQDLIRFLDPKQSSGLLYGYPINVVSGKGYVEVKHEFIDKGIAVRRVLDAFSKQVGSKPDFVLCIGDDRADEDMFHAISKWKGEDSPEPRSPDVHQLRPSGVRKKGQTLEDFVDNFGETVDQCFTATVGRKPSKATFFVKDINDVGSLLQKLSQEGVKTKFSRVSSVPSMEGLSKMSSRSGLLPAFDAIDED